MLKFYVDFNTRGTSERGNDSILIKLDFINKGISEAELSVGQKVLLCDEEMECEAILCRDEHNHWRADMILETIKHLPEDQWDRFRHWKE